MEHEKNPGARGKVKKEHGAHKNQKGAMKKVKRSKGRKTERSKEQGEKV